MTLSITPAATVVPRTKEQSSWANGVVEVANFTLNPWMCKCYFATAWNILTSNWTKASFDTDLFDPFGMHNTASNASRITPNISDPCWLAFNAFARFNQFDGPTGLVDVSTTTVSGIASGGFRGMQLRANSGGSDTGGTGVLTKHVANPPHAHTTVEINRKILYTPGDYFEVFLWQNSGSTGKVDSGSQISGLEVEFVSFA